MAIPIKTKASYPVSRSEAKRHLRVEDDFHEDDDYIDNLIIAATVKAEQYIGKDIAETSNTQEIYDFLGDAIRLPEGNFRSFTQGVTDASTLVVVDHTDIFYNTTFIQFSSSYDSDPLTITYETGYAEGECPILIKQAVLIKIADLYDVNRQSYSIGNVTGNNAFESLLDSFRYVTF
jgi:hypothetical protein